MYDFRHQTEKKEFQYISVQSPIECDTYALAFENPSYTSFETFMQQPTVLGMMIISFDNLLPCHLYINRIFVDLRPIPRKCQIGSIFSVIIRCPLKKL